MFRTHGVERVHVLGHTISLRPGPRPFNERDGILFVGAIHHESTPNGDAVIWFLSEVLPLIKARLGRQVPFTIVGVNQSDRIRQLADDSVRILGYLKDLDDLYDAARIFVAPTRYAAGIPHKVHEAAARGLPVIATPLLATQLGWKDLSTFAVGSDAETFARKCIELYSDETLWSKMRAAGLERVRAECSQSAFEAQLKEILGSEQARFADVGMDR
jgi:glycosyltransferase involved in cell wall biosynthesis